MKKVLLKHNSLTPIVGMLIELGLIRYKNELRGIKGLSSMPRWKKLEGYYFNEMNILLTDEAINLIELNNSGLTKDDREFIRYEILN